MPKKIFVLLLSVLCMVSLAGCGNDSSSDEKTLTLLAKTNTEDYIDKIINLYEEKTGNKINLVEIYNTSFETEAAKMFEGDDAPDLLIHFNDANLANFNVPENFYYMNNEKWVDELTDGAKACAMDSDGNVLGLPFWESSISGCYYNKTLLDSLGLRPASTQAEFDMLCKALKSVGYTPMYWAANDCNWMFQFGLDPIFADDPSLLKKLNKNEIKYADIPAVKDMITWLDSAAKQGWFNNNYAEVAWDDIPPAIGNGEAATIFAWDTWFSTDFKEGNKYSKEDFALMPVFMNTVEMGTYEGGNMAMIMANKNSKKLELALDFLSFCATPENYNVAFDGVPTIDCFKNQTTNIQSDMVTNAMVSIEANQRVSTAWPKIIGYKQNDVGDAILKLFKGEVDVDGCIELMDKYRIDAAKDLGTKGF